MCANGCSRAPVPLREAIPARVVSSLRSCASRAGSSSRQEPFRQPARKILRPDEPEIPRRIFLELWMEARWGHRTGSELWWRADFPCDRRDRVRRRHQSGARRLTQYRWESACRRSRWPYRRRIRRRGWASAWKNPGAGMPRPAEEDGRWWRAAAAWRWLPRRMSCRAWRCCAHVGNDGSSSHPRHSPDEPARQCIHNERHDKQHRAYGHQCR